MRLIDNFGRKINYLRLSITDRCNMRCVYCMPANGVKKIDHEAILSYEHFLMIARAAVSLGIEKIRVTGGEPLVRQGIIPFLQQLAKTDGLKQLVLTTNGVKLAGMAQALKDAGVQRLNISLDSLQPARFAQLTRRDFLPEVLAGIDAVEKIGLSFKLNMVVMRGRNDHEICDFAALTKQHDCTVRFIEYMPVMKEEGWQGLVVPSAEILQTLQNHYVLYSIDNGPLAGPAREFTIAGARGRLGVIDPLSGHFCGDCNRIRITASGKVRTCLFSDHEFDLRPILQLNDVGKLSGQLKSLVGDKPACHNLNAPESARSAFSMAHIGG